MISEAYAQTAATAAQPSPTMNLLFMGALFVIMYFVMLRPQMKRQKESRRMLAALQAGDEVVTQGGLMGRIEKIDEQVLTLVIAVGVSIQVQRSAVVALLPKGRLSF